MVYTAGRAAVNSRWVGGFFAPLPCHLTTIISIKYTPSSSNGCPRTHICGASDSSLPARLTPLHFLSHGARRYAFCPRVTPRKTTKLSNPAGAQARATQTDLAPPFRLPPQRLISTPAAPAPPPSTSPVAPAMTPRSKTQLSAQARWHHRAATPACFRSSFSAQFKTSQGQMLAC